MNLILEYERTVKRGNHFLDSQGYKKEVHGYNGGMKEASLNKRKKMKRQVYKIMGWQRKQEQR